MCSRCNCFTCVDDIAFVRTLIARINEGYCVDESRLYVGGASNGGMFTYYLASQIPELVTGGYLLMCGQPMVGWLNTPKKAAESYMISLHGRSDDVLPPAGGVDGDDMWLYESLNNTFYVWGVAQGCDISSWERVKTPFDDIEGNLNLKCY
jgi:polyhydroxybutyrate depolymerase